MRQFPTRHRHEWTMAAFNDLQVANNKTIVERNRTEGTKPVFRFFHEFDSDLSDVHSVLPPCEFSRYVQLGSLFSLALVRRGATSYDRERAPPRIHLHTASR